MKTMSGVDGAFLHLETPETPMHVASLHLFDLPAGYRGDFYAKVKRQMAQRLHLAPVLTRKLAPMPLQFANPVWIEDDEIDLDYHVQRVNLPGPGTQAQLEDIAARLHSETLDRHRPLWRLAVIDGLQTGQAGYYFQVHHAVLDGQAGVLLANALFDAAPQPRRIRRGVASIAEHPGIVELAAAALKHDAGQYIKLLRHLPNVVKMLAGMLGATSDAGKAQLGQNFSFGPKTPLNVPITGERGFATATIALPTLERLAAAHEAKLNDIVLALCSGALRRYLVRHGGVPNKPLIATMPISLREAGNTEYTTQATLSLVNLHTHIADPVKRLRAIRDSAGAAKSLAKRARGVIPTDFPSIGTPWLLRALAALYGRLENASAMPPIANVVISNVPGPPVPLYEAGARMASYWPLSIVEHGVGLNITVMSYAGNMGFGFATARSAVPHASELPEALEAALNELLVKRRGAAPRRLLARSGATGPSRVNSTTQGS
jgi:diacylglycerol O-acyltransferase / wax synthase